MLIIHQRPFTPADRFEAGHWEGNLIVGRDHASAIGIRVERRTRTIRPLHLSERSGSALHRALAERMRDLPPVTTALDELGPGDRDGRHTDITADLGVPIYLYDPHTP